MHRAIHKALRAGAWVVLVAFVCVVLFSVLVSCTAMEKRTWINTGCEMECETCNGVKLRCDNETGRNSDSDAQGVISGGGTGGG